MGEVYNAWVQHTPKTLIHSTNTESLLCDMHSNIQNYREYSLLLLETQTSCSGQQSLGESLNINKHIILASPYPGGIQNRFALTHTMTCSYSGENLLIFFKMLTLISQSNLCIYKHLHAVIFLSDHFANNL